MNYFCRETCIIHIFFVTLYAEMNANEPLRLIIGPCAVESAGQMRAVASSLDAAFHSVACGVRIILRAGLWKPRSRPDSFQGVGAEGLPWLTGAADALGVPAATEVATPEHLLTAYDAGIRHFWIGARTTSNPFMVEALATVPIADKASVTWYVKNPTSPDIELWCGAIERLRQAGYEQVAAIHRGFALGECSASAYRNAPVWSVPIELKRRYPTLPVLTDASHIAGRAALVADVARQAMRIGMDGLMIEVHPCPAEALSDAEQQLTPEELGTLLADMTTSRHDDMTKNPTDELSALREQIDETDDELWALISRRLHIAEQIGAYKRANNLPVLQTARYDEILSKRMAWAAGHGIDPQAAKQIMDIIHEQSVLAQT